MQAIHDELQRDHLSAGGLDALRQAIDRSWEVLDPAQGRLFAALSLLEGASFPRWAALAIAAAAAATGDDKASAPDHDDRATRDAANKALETLVRLLLVEPQAGERLRLHPRLREYADERFAAPALSDADRKALSAAFLASWVAFAEQHPDLDGMNALDVEAPGLMGALKWAHDHGEHTTVLALAYALTTYWYVRGRVADAVLALPWAVAAARTRDSKTDQCFMIHSLAVFQAQTGDCVAARAGYTEALRLARELNSPRDILDELHGLAVLDANEGNRAGARAGYTEALRLARELNDPRAIRAELHELAVLDAEEGNRVAARAGFTEALRLARELGDPAAQVRELYTLGSLDLNDGDPVAARTELNEALALARPLQQPALIVEAVWWLAELEKRSGNREAACAGFREALVLYDALGHPDAAITRERLAKLECAS